MKQIVQCVPNISEGRDESIIHAITEPLKEQKGFKLVSVEADPNYNRSVITLIGDPKAMEEPLVRFFGKALELIDMRTHQGEHPRMGAVDVLPIIPIAGVTTDEAVAMAKALAEKVSQTYQLPIYLYALAATTEDRVNLPTIRKGEFEGLKEKMKDPVWVPDVGPNKPHETFGACAIGARNPLLAYNINLMTNQIKVAKAIARTIRKSSGGFQYVQAGPAMIEETDSVQVTMNILDHSKNPIYRVLEMVKMEARRYHVDIPSSEIIGLVPRSALLESIKYYQACADEPHDKDIDLERLARLAVDKLGLTAFDHTKIIEWHI